MAKRDYYEILGVSKDASKDEIKRAYRKLSKQYHPDINKEPGADEKFKEISEAYEVLSDDTKRAQYDQFGHAGANQDFDGFGGFGGFSDAGFGGFEDILNTFFGGGSTRRRNPNAPRQGADLQYTMTLTFEEAVFGKETDIEIPREEECSTCHGSGAKPGTHPEECPYCHGSGQISTEQNTPFGRIVNRRVCHHCGGTGQVIKHKCPTCHGTGKVKKRKKIHIKIPAGIDNGQQLRVAGKGEPGINGGPNGDLYIIFQVKEHEFFERDSDDIYCEMPISFVQAALGDEIEVPTLYGKVKLKIPAGTQTNTKFRLRGKGVKSVRSTTPGDQHVIVRIVTPTKLTEKQKQLLREFAEISGKTPDEQTDTFFEKVKRAFKGE
ncbi:MULTISPECIES: molecular chaperone DnaJ [Bacillaceae]|jgi:molecular chaperone DnaJ|uniref:Chaperone protein DnaJ n=1 Tax=Caldibacillus thermoamylovorans TaxID=35841 RepID=A0A090IWJ4_9BACI|nr:MULTISPECIES: molecular chaperone DnaJ [Bacillaceae]MCM3054397.1 molecular chaperone DnaJ [Caldibacillus thermoamylovorans]MCM3478265.1 molecular chaperone DnaJ [Caldibacillus thermoamylovorans]MEC5270643.1 molecular chaperone DnaJ [Caldifermentibacillus hisashii]MED4851067.1 molecular chaperone DnaJ [Caldifermentibacillus hisashii]CEE02082.1 Chaperone protein DnaJ [Caldibacillus thermoamylovorans]